METTLFEQVLKATVSSGASDLHLKVGSPCMVREGNDLVPMTENTLRASDVEMVVERIIEQVGSRYGSASRFGNIKEIRDFDASYSLPGVGRFRVNIYRQRGTLAVSMRIIPSKVPSIDDLSLPTVLKEIAVEQRGMILVTGTTGSGYSAPVIGRKAGRYMKKKTIYTDEPMKVGKIVKDFLPSPEELVFKEETVKVTIGLSRESIAFFKRIGQENRIPYQKLIRRLLDTYVQSQNALQRAPEFTLNDK